MTTPFLAGLVDLLAVGEHLVLGLQGDQGDADTAIALALDAGEAAGDVHGDVAAADDDDGLGDLEGLAKGDAAQEVHGGVDLRVIAAGDTGGAALVQTDGEQHGVVLGAQLVHLDVLADAGAAADLDPHRSDDCRCPRSSLS